MNAYTRRNGGDAAILSGTLAQLRVAAPGARIAFSSLEDPNRERWFEGSRNIGSIRRWAGDEAVGRARRATRKLACLGLLLLPARVLRAIGRWAGRGWEPAAEIDALGRADVVVGLGGGYLNGAPGLPGTMNVFFLVLPLLLAERLRRPVVLAAQSYGPFNGPLQRALTRRALNGARHLEAREATSAAVLEGIGVHSELIRRGVDVAFSSVFASPPRAGLREILGAPPLLVGLTVRRFLDQHGQAAYEREIAGFVDWATEDRGATFVVLPQVVAEYQGDDDRLVARRVADRCRLAPYVIDRWVPHRDLRAMYAELDVLVGTRFHSVVFALLSSTPALAIEYEHKTSGIMRDLGLERWVVPMAGLREEDLRARFDELLSEREGYARHLRHVLPAYRLRADEFIDSLRSALKAV